MEAPLRASVERGAHWTDSYRSAQTLARLPPATDQPDHLSGVS